MQGFPPPPELRVAVDQVYSDVRRTQWFMQHVREVVPTAGIATIGEIIELPGTTGDGAAGGNAGRPVPADWRDDRDLLGEPGLLDDLELLDAGDADAGAPAGTWTFAGMLAATDTDGIIVLHDGHVLCERYFGSLRPRTPHLWHSITKSLGACAAAGLVDAGRLDPDAPVVRYVPELVPSAYGEATVRHLLDMTVGIRYVEDHEDFDSEDSRLDRLCGLKPRRAADEPGSIYDYATTTVKDGEHGRMLRYVSLNSDVLGWVMERASGRSVPDLLHAVWALLGGEHDAHILLDGAGSALLDGGLSSSLRDLARFGLMIADHGEVAGRRVVPRWWIDDTLRNGDRAAFAASDDPDMLPRGSYRNCFWVAESRGRRVLLGIGMYGQMLFVDPQSRTVIAKFSSQPRAGLAGPITRTFHALDSLTGLLTKEATSA